MICSTPDFIFYKTRLYYLVPQVSSVSIRLLGISFFHLWPEIRQSFGSCFWHVNGYSIFPARRRANQVGSPRGVCAFSLLRFAAPSHRCLGAFSDFCGVLKITPLHREDIWMLRRCVWLYDACVFSLKKKANSSPLLMFILIGLVKFLLWMESFFPRKVNLLEILLETSVWLLSYPGKQPTRAMLRDSFNLEGQEPALHCQAVQLRILQSAPKDSNLCSTSPEGRGQTMEVSTVGRHPATQERQ